MPEEYGVLNHVVPVGTDPAQIPKTFKDYDDSLTAELLAFPPSQLATAGAGDEGKLLIVQNTGDAVFKALSGDVTVNAAGVVEIGKEKVGSEELGKKAVGADKLNDSAVTEGKTADGAMTSRKAKLTAGVVAASENLTLTTSYQDVPGAVLEITPAVASILKVTAVFKFAAANSAEALGTVRLDATDQTPDAALGAGNSIEALGTVVQTYFLSLSAAAHTIRMRAKRTTFGAGEAKGSGTQFLYELIAS